MDQTDVVSVFLAGGLVGFGFGYLVKAVRDIRDVVVEEKKEVDVLFAIAKKNHPEDFGAVRWDLLRHVTLFLVVVLVAYSAIVSGIASNRSDRAVQNVQQVQKASNGIVVCNQEFLAKTIRALNERTEFTVAQTEANVELQKDQARFFTLLLEQPPRVERERRQAAERYLDSLTHFVSVSGQAKRQVETNPFPTNEELSDCLATQLSNRS
jgi:hypothetical protein